MFGLIQDRPLLISSLIAHAARHHGATEIVSRDGESPLHRYTIRDAHARARQLAKALARLGIASGDRVATLAWNSHRHLEFYYAVSGLGAICHTVNPRLFHDQIVYIVNHAEDKAVFFDLACREVVERLRPLCPTVRHWVAMADRASLASAAADTLCYEELLAAETDDFAWPVFDERLASSLCYTSGTTGDPKGALYAHRSTVLHSYGTALPDCLNLSARDVICPVVPMFHVNAWGLPYSAMLVGAKLVLPGAALDGKSLYDLFDAEQVTVSAGVPTVWFGLLRHLAEHRLRLSSLKRLVIGGSACPPAMIERFEQDYGVEILHAWGMTEMSPIGTFAQLKGKHRAADAAALLALKSKQGRVIPGVDLKIVDGAGNELPWDGTSFGDLLVRGWWVAAGYYRAEGGSPLRDGWFPTGDVATIDADGYLQITDRSKDVIKSGGEWISSIELENIAVAHPAVAEAAVVGVPHPKWGERPLLVVQLKPGHAVERDALLGFYRGRTAAWRIPSDVVLVDALPHTATGKLLKAELRRRYADYRLPDVPETCRET
ncbi:MAG TPA: 3-(methylthio)propionyl-CoA ligase [Stellaceae bacterium]|nr:3-(methylthio)propionyl-CoA ligase [Stellaceae bacterium]